MVRAVSSSKRTASEKRRWPSKTVPDDLPRPRGLDGVEHVSHRDAVAGAAVAVDLDPQHRQAGRLLQLHVGRPGHACHHARDLLALLAQGLEVVAEQLDADVGAHARDQLVEAHLDRLGEGEAHPRDGLAERVLHLLDQLALGPGRRPLGPGLQDHEDVSQLDAHHVGRQLRAARAADDRDAPPGSA